MKNSILNLGKALNKAEQKKVTGGFKDPCPCSVNYEAYSDGSCSFPANGTITTDPFIGGRCLGEIQNNLCCL